ncbi:MAG: hypothetical protein II610_01070 [Treponema sp.]|nr:hypothetical protein [Treponema sp.]
MKIDISALEAYIKEKAGEKDAADTRKGHLWESDETIKKTIRINPVVTMSPRHHPNFGELEKKLSAPNCEDFISRLIYYINEKGMSHPQVYNAAGMTPDCFSKIISGKTKAPKKESVVALALALGLNLDEAADLLSCAGLSLSGVKQDLIFEFCFKNGPYSVDDVNDALVHFGFAPIGGVK